MHAYFIDKNDIWSCDHASWLMPMFGGGGGGGEGGSPGKINGEAVPLRP